ncbi:MULTISPECIES: MetQ/NlpA family ABC transporter substrate-binding protein [Streptomyces]|uniref:Lipoprotein n=1 Tax=Streptomyces thermoviolaceus subsp. thermoviolaceus TaxID=66860 RepID=A0ABX0YK57_STRTL|nr:MULTISPECIES: MetQ/NlpA family ABC transporter substrate-binding protein [Streptomyces]MCM3263962.1 MetQ/NlpA family ABC transporter substrate-binding protein [Streptomyces thermoviolaceus]NJP12857.1 ABC transporter substrate-binding protein [Streptomyces thermoviolaceus subsp. thermoviolaceus]RSR99474.1 ABC transporter substrate-binding protein [Streptomyces sp. WAC00469]WTD49974.1 MetQ/NlpA family ABC transporter substrate-binding protein [Streptomyces thermoviolaceus]GHA81429.1 lipoprote
MRNTAKITATVLAAGALTLGLTACGSGSDSGSKDANAPLTVAATPTPQGEILAYVKDHLAQKAGLKLEIKEFTDYVTPNTAVQQGQVDANYFQHKPYLDDFNKKNGTDIVPVPGATVHLEPLGVYSKSLKKLDDLKKGATIALPNDTTNEARALKLLEANGVIQLKAGVGYEATPKDVTSNPKDITFKELEAAQLPRSLSDVDAAVINGNYALEAELSPAKDALAAESAQDNPYANFLAVKKGNENDPRVKKLAQLLTSPEVKKFIEDTYDGAVVPAF